MTKWFDRPARDRRIAALRERYINGKVTLFIGAGVTASCGLPLWNKLSDGILAHAFPEQEGWGRAVHHHQRFVASSKGPVEAMRIARQALKDGFIPAVRHSLYASPHFFSDTIRSISSLDKITRIVSYNYDDLLEQCVEIAGRACVSVISAETNNDNSEKIKIYHPHGFIPESGNSESADIILSEDDYFRLYGDSNSWSNLVQLKYLLSSTCLFVGCSLLDTNIRRLLDISKNFLEDRTHYVLLQDPTSALEDRGSNSNWDTLVFPPIIAMEEKNLQGRGITPIWYNQHDDIPHIIHQMLDNDGLRQYGERVGESEVIAMAVEMLNNGSMLSSIGPKLIDMGLFPRNGSHFWENDGDWISLFKAGGVDISNDIRRLKEFIDP